MTEHTWDDFEPITAEMPHEQHTSRTWILTKRWWMLGELIKIEVHVN